MDARLPSPRHIPQPPLQPHGALGTSAGLWDVIRNDVAHFHVMVSPEECRWIPLVLFIPPTHYQGNGENWSNNLDPKLEAML